MDSFTLTAGAAFGHAGQYVARLTGRSPKFTFLREFLGRRLGKRGEITEHTVDEPGLYECCDVTKRGKDSRYYLILPFLDGLHELKISRAEAMKIARAIEGKDITDCVTLVDENHWAFAASPAARKLSAARTESEAIDKIVAILAALPVNLAKKVLAAARKRLTPPPATPAAGSDAPPGIIIAQGEATPPAPASEVVASISLPVSEMTISMPLSAFADAASAPLPPHEASQTTPENSAAAPECA